MPFLGLDCGHNEKETDMPQYCVNRTVQANGDHEVHAEGCIYWPHPQNVQPLGWHAFCQPAVQAARAFYYQVNGCRTCSTGCHTQ
jgi:hypothetical protein